METTTHDTLTHDTATGHEPLTHIVTGSKAVGWWGIVMHLLIESSVFAGLIASYFYLFANSDVWPPEPAPSMGIPIVYTIVLLASGAFAFIGEKALEKDDVSRMKLWRLAGCAALAIFLVLKIYEYANLSYRWDDNAYSSIVWLIAGFHSAHVFTVLIKELAIQALAYKGFFSAKRRGAIEAATLYWMFVALMWIPLSLTTYIFPNYV